MDPFVVQPAVVLGWFLAPTGAAVVGYLLGKLNGVRMHDKAMEKGMRAILRQQLIDYHAQYVASGAGCPVSVKEQATNIYEAYHALGGNGTGTRLWEEIMAAHVVELKEA